MASWATGWPSYRISALTVVPGLRVRLPGLTQLASLQGNRCPITTPVSQGRASIQ